jgi:hypothetical protein
MHYFDDNLLLTASLLCDRFYILWLQPCKDVLERVNKYNTIQTRQNPRGQTQGREQEREGGSRGGDRDKINQQELQLN